MMAVTAGNKTGGDGPVELTSFVGRRRELSVVRQLLEDTRCVTIMGPPGVGKTRVALRTAAGARRQPAGDVWWVALDKLAEPDHLGSLLLEHTHLREESGRDPVDLVAEYVGDWRLVLVLDHCDHVVDACAQAVTRLLQACPRLRVLATSRQSLGVCGEQRYVLGPLPVPPPAEHSAPVERLRQYPAVGLFVDRVRAFLPEFALGDGDGPVVVWLCRRLDGLPLALELAAVGLRTLSLEQLAQRLPAAFGALPAAGRRSQSLRAAIAASYQMCSADEARLWSRASVFAGSFDLANAEAITAGNGVPPAEVSGLVDALVDKSLLVRDDEDTNGAARYRMLQPLRDYAHEALVAAGEEARMAARHRDRYAERAQRFAATWLGPHQPDWMGWWRREHANLRAALEFCASQPGQADDGLALVVRLHEYWSVRGLHSQARWWAHRLLDASSEPTRWRLAGLRLAARLALLQGDTATFHALLREATALAEHLSEPIEQAHLAALPGMAALLDGDPAGAETAFGNALARFDELGDTGGMVVTRCYLGLTVGLYRDYGAGQAQLHACQQHLDTLGERYWRSWVLWAAAHLAVVHGHHRHAEDHALHSLRLQQELDNRFTQAFTLDTLACANAACGEYRRAAVLFGAAAAAWHEVGTAPEHYATLARTHQQHHDHTQAALGEDAFQRGCDEGRTLSAAAAADYARQPQAATEPLPAVRDQEDEPLTPREREIAALVATGYTNQDIARRLVISQRTVEGHVQHILIKLRFTSRAQIAAWMSTRPHPAHE